MPTSRDPQTPSLGFWPSPLATMLQSQACTTVSTAPNSCFLLEQVPGQVRSFGAYCCVFISLETSSACSSVACTAVVTAKQSQFGNMKGRHMQAHSHDMHMCLADDHDRRNCGGCILPCNQNQPSKYMTTIGYSEYSDCVYQTQQQMVHIQHSSEQNKECCIQIVRFEHSV